MIRYQQDQLANTCQSWVMSSGCISARRKSVDDATVRMRLEIGRRDIPLREGRPAIGSKGEDPDERCPCSRPLTSGSASPRNRRGRRCLSGSPRRPRPSFCVELGEEAETAAQDARARPVPRRMASRARRLHRRGDGRDGPGSSACPGHRSRRRGRRERARARRGRLDRARPRRSAYAPTSLASSSGRRPGADRSHGSALKLWRDGKAPGDAGQGAARQSTSVDSGVTDDGEASYSLRREPATRSTPAWPCWPRPAIGSSPATPATCGQLCEAAGIRAVVVGC